MADESFIHIRGARQNNLKNIELRIPRNKFVVITGVSGSGKSSLAFDTLFAEGQRRYLEALSTFARQAVGRLNAPLVDEITGLSPSIAIEQKGLPHNPRSTVGTLTEIHDYLRLIFARLGTVFCPNCNLPVRAWTVPEIVADLQSSLPPNSRILILAPLGPAVPCRAEVQASSRDPGGSAPGVPRLRDVRSVSHEALPNLLKKLRRDGFARVRVDGAVYELDPLPAIPRRTSGAEREARSVKSPLPGRDWIPAFAGMTGGEKESAFEALSHVVQVVIDRLALGGVVGPPAGSAASPPGPLPGAEPPHPSFGGGKSGSGGMPAPRRLIDSLELALKVGKGTASVATVEGWEKSYSESARCASCGYTGPERTPGLFSFLHPLGMCPACQGLGADIGYQVWDIGKTSSASDSRHPTPDTRLPTSDVRPPTSVCPACNGTRLSQAARSVRLGGLSIDQVSAMTPAQAVQWLTDIGYQVCDIRKPNEELTTHHSSFITNHSEILDRPRKEILARLNNLVELGLPYLTLDRSSNTLSGGEAQRVRLAHQLASRLSGVLYVLDEPSVGLHPRDHQRLLDVLMRLRDAGNSLVVVEHDRETILRADHLIDMGPGAGTEGGEVVFSGPPGEIVNCPESLTGLYISGKKRLTPLTRREKLEARNREQEAEPAPATFLGGESRQNLPCPPLQKGGKAGFIPASHFPVSSIRLTGATGHNLKSVSVDFPYGCMTCVTGVSGSGKSTLVIDTLYRALVQMIYNVQTHPALARVSAQSRPTAQPPGARNRAIPSGGRSRQGGASDGIAAPPAPFLTLENADRLRKVIMVDQSPIGRTPRSTPATYTGVFDLIRELFSRVPEARARGWSAARFSFNQKGGRCEHCGGQGAQQIEMYFLPDIYVVCPFCQGSRYRSETLEITYRGHSIASVLEMTVFEAAGFFSNFRQIRHKLDALIDVGMGYIRLGQPATTLSGGEAQRVKLAAELGRRGQGAALYILDEPTTGLHFDDIAKLLLVLRKLVEQKNTVIIIEHHPDVIKSCDYVIDLGPEGGEGGGRIVAQGTPEEVARSKDSHTARWLRKTMMNDE